MLFLIGKMNEIVLDGNDDETNPIPGSANWSIITREAKFTERSNASFKNLKPVLDQLEHV
jgi:hypothetical protein